MAELDPECSLAGVRADMSGFEVDDEDKDEDAELAPSKRGDSSAVALIGDVRPRDGVDAEEDTVPALILGGNPVSFGDNGTHSILSVSSPPSSVELLDR